MKFKTVKLAETQNLPNTTANRIAKAKLKEAAKNLHLLKTRSPELCVKICLPVPSNDVKNITASKSRPRRSFQKRKIITSTPHFTKDKNKDRDRFSNGGSSILSPIVRESSTESVEINHQPTSTEKRPVLDDSDSEIEDLSSKKQPKPRNKKRVNTDHPDFIPNKKKDPVEEVNASSDIIFVDNKRDEAPKREESPKKPRRQKKSTKNKTTPIKKPLQEPDLPIASDQGSSPHGEIVVHLTNIMSPPRDRSEFVNKTPRSGRSVVNFANLRDDPDIEAFARSMGLTPRHDGLVESPSPKSRYNSRSSRTAIEKARNLTEFHEAEKLPNDVHTTTEKGKASKETTDLQNGGSSPKYNLIEDITLRKAALITRKDNDNEFKNTVSTNQDKIVQSPRKKSQKATNKGKTQLPKVIEKIRARALRKQIMPAPPQPVEMLQDETTHPGHDNVSETILKPNSGKEQLSTNINEAGAVMSEGPSTSETLAPRRNDKTITNPSNQLEGLKALLNFEGRKSGWDKFITHLNSFAEAVEQRGEQAASDLSSNSRGSEELFSVGNANKKINKFVDQNIQTEAISAPRRSTGLKNKSSKSRIPIDVPEFSDTSPNIYDSLEQGNEIDALGFSNSDEPMLSFKHKPFRCDTPSRSISTLQWTDPNLVLSPNSPSDAVTLQTSEIDLSPQPYNRVETIKKYNNKTNTTSKSAYGTKSNLVEPNRELSSADASVPNNEIEKVTSPRRITRSLTGSSRQNNTDTNAKKKLNFDKRPTEVLSLNEANTNKNKRDKSSNLAQESTEEAAPADRETQAKANASRERRNKSLEKNSALQTHYNIMLQTPQFDKGITRVVDSSVNFSRKTLHKSMEKNQSTLSKSSRLEQSVIGNRSTSKNRSEKSSSSKHPTLEPPRFSRHDVSDILRSTAPMETRSQNKDSSFEQQQQDSILEPMEVDNGIPEISAASSKGRKQRTKSNSKQQTLEPPQSSQVDVSSSSRLNGQIAFVDINNEVPDSSAASPKRQTKSSSKEHPQNTTLSPSQQRDISNNLRNSHVSMVGDNEVPDNSKTRSKGKRQHKKSNSKRQPQNSTLKPPPSVPDDVGVRLRSKSRNKSLRENEHLEDGIPTSANTSSTKGNKTNNNNNEERDSIVSEELPQNLTLEPHQSVQAGVSTRLSRSKLDKENERLVDEAQSSAATSGIWDRNTNNNISASRASRGKVKKSKKESKKTGASKKLQIDVSNILPDQGGRRSQRNRKPPRHCPIVEFGVSVQSYGINPKILKGIKIHSERAKLIATQNSTRTSKVRASRATSQLEPIPQSPPVRIEEPIPETTPPPPQNDNQNVSDSIATQNSIGLRNRASRANSQLETVPQSLSVRIEEPIPEITPSPPQNDHQNVSDSILMPPPPPTNLLRIPNPEESEADSGFDKTNSVMEKAKTKVGKGRGGRKTTKATKTLQQVPEPSNPIMERSNDSQQGPDQSQNLEPEDHLYQIVDGKVYMTQFTSNPPTHLDYTQIGHLFVREITKEPNSQYTVGFLRLEKGDSKKGTSSKKFSFVYVVIAGVAEVAVENKVCTVNTGGYFWVPVGMTYSIKNTSLDSYLDIHFTRIRADNK